MTQAKKTRSEAATTPPDALLTAAFHVFASRGYRASRLEEVAEEAGLTKGAIYYHFDSKEELLRRAVEHRHEAIFAAIESELATLDAPASVRIRYVLRQLWRHVLEPVWGQALRLMFGEVGLEFPALFRMWAEEGPIHAWKVVADLIQEGVRDGEFRPGVDAEVAARFAVSGLMMQAALQVHSGLQELAPCDVDRIFDSGVDLFIHGLAASSVASPITAPEREEDAGRESRARARAMEALRPIGRVENGFDVGAPTDAVTAAVSRIVIDPELAEGLSGLEAGQRVLVLFWFHQSDGSELLQHPRGDVARPLRGVFALRSPRRPNPIGATVVELMGRSGNVLEVRGLDAIDGTPVLDLKPD